MVIIAWLLGLIVVGAILGLLTILALVVMFALGASFVHSVFSSDEESDTVIELEPGQEVSVEVTERDR